MWGSITNFTNNILSFLSSNKVPPNTPLELQSAYRKENHLKSKKFFLAFTSFIGLLFFYLLSVCILFLLPQQNALISGYVTIFTKTIEIIAIIVASYIGVQAVVDLKYGSSSNTTYLGNITSEQREELIIEEQTIKYAKKYEDDPSYAPVDWVFDNE
jgi:hypothetical protein